MKHKIFNIELFITVILSLAFHQLAIANEVYIYRGVGATENGSVNLGPTQFKWTGTPNTTLSAFDSTTPNTFPVTPQAKCYFRFSVSGNFSVPPEPQQQGNMTGDDLEGFTAIFDNNPQGHWSINHPAHINDEDAKKIISKYAKENAATAGNIQNGSQNNCRAPQKNTPN